MEQWADELLGHGPSPVLHRSLQPQMWHWLLGTLARRP